MFMFDIETLGVESNSVILSFACIYFDPASKPSYEDLVASAFFAKLDVYDQKTRLGRTISQSTMEWWATISSETRAVSFTPKQTDLKAEEAIEALREWTKQFPNSKTCPVWARGNMDQSAFASLENACNVSNVFFYNRWRDVRTAVDLLCGSSNGYAEVEYEGFKSYKVLKHNPIHDCAYDVMQMLYGKKS